MLALTYFLFISVRIKDKKRETYSFFLTIIYSVQLKFNYLLIKLQIVVRVVYLFNNILFKSNEKVKL